ncbi:unnamed protein product [Brachionus calyciflorus]|uniref:Uncharacterized protein n=1 Tax=Brachionus calyciflorus TaxID=104777 RepID=A0A814KUY5_9BILA|nr:unnamed protein product [Brachionus calyciflorus]
MNTLVNSQITAIDCFLAFLTQRRHKQYDNLGTTAFNFLKSSDYTEINLVLQSLNLNEKITEKHLPRLLKKIFTSFDPMKLGHQAINIISDIKKYNSKIPFMKYDANNELSNFCNEVIISIEHINCSIFIENTNYIIPETQIHPNVTHSSQVPISSTAINQNLNSNRGIPEQLSQIDFSANSLNNAFQHFMKEISSKIELNSENRDKYLIDKMSQMLRDHKRQTTPTEIKDKYYEELNKNFDKIQRFENQLAINSSYLSNDIFPGPLSNDKFPLPMYCDKDDFKDKYYNELIFGFKKDILNFNIDYLNNQINFLKSSNQSLSDKVDEIDENVNDKIQILISKAKSKYESDLTKGMEKINRLISAKNESNNSNDAFPKINNTNSEQTNDKISSSDKNSSNKNYSNNKSQNNNQSKFNNFKSISSKPGVKYHYIHQTGSKNFQNYKHNFYIPYSNNNSNYSNVNNYQQSMHPYSRPNYSHSKQTNYNNYNKTSHLNKPQQ